MPEELDDFVVDFLKDSIAYLVNRIQIVDNKANIMLAVEGVLLGSLTYVVNEFFLKGSSHSLAIWSCIVLVAAFVLFTATASLLLQAIRPARLFFGLKVPFTKMPLEKYVMWYSPEFPSTPEDYTKIIDSLDSTDIKKNYYKQHFISLQLVRYKYRAYALATSGLKALVVWIFVGIALLTLLKLKGV